MALQLCGLVGGNTGGIACAASPGKITSIGIWGGELTPAEYATPALAKTALVADSKLSKTLSDKLFLLPLFQGKESKKESNTETTLSNGLKIVTREGLPGWRFSFFTSMSQMKNLRKFNNTTVKVLMQDDQKRAWGSVDSENNLVGRQAQLFFEGLDHIGDDGVIGLGFVNIAFIDAIENYDDAAFVALDFNFNTTLKALLEVVLYEAAVATVNVLHVAGKIDVSDLALPMQVYTEFAAPLAVGALWYAKNLQTGAAIAITSVAQNAAGYWDVTLNSAAYTALNSGDLVEVGTVLPTALDAASVPGIETAYLVHVKP